MSLIDLHLDSFMPHLGSAFRPQGAPFVLTLKEASDLGSTSRQEQFALLFSGPSEPLLEQATYRLEHEQLGTLDLFLVPLARDAACATYQSIFNRLLGR